MPTAANPARSSRRRLALALLVVACASGEDVELNCAGWAWTGECVANPGYMLWTCAYACALVGERNYTPTPDPPWRPPEVVICAAHEGPGEPARVLVERVWGQVAIAANLAQRSGNEADYAQLRQIFADFEAKYRAHYDELDNAFRANVEVGIQLIRQRIAQGERQRHWHHHGGHQRQHHHHYHHQHHAGGGGARHERNPDPEGHYAKLGVQSVASAAEIRAAYRKLALQHHPDKNLGNADATALFIEVRTAYDAVGDEERRKQYDAGMLTNRPGFGGGGFNGRGNCIRVNGQTMCF
jgi:DnaJ-domain-containing protein 1